MPPEREPMPLIWRNRGSARDATLAASRTSSAAAMPSRSRSKTSTAFIGAAFLLALGAGACANAADIARGRALYELRCDACHSESVHGRTHRVAKDLAAVRGWVRRWNESLAVGWGDAEIDDVAAYLNAAYYKFDCTTPACSAVSMTPRARAR